MKNVCNFVKKKCTILQNIPIFLPWINVKLDSITSHSKKLLVQFTQMRLISPAKHFGTHLFVFNSTKFVVLPFDLMRIVSLHRFDGKLITTKNWFDTESMVETKKCGKQTISPKYTHSVSERPKEKKLNIHLHEIQTRLCELIGFVLWFFDCGDSMFNVWTYWSFVWQTEYTHTHAINSSVIEIMIKTFIPIAFFF